MRLLLLSLMLSVVTAMLLAASGVAAAQVPTESPTGTGPTDDEAPEDVGPTERPPVGEVDDIVAVDGGLVGAASSDQSTVVAEEDPDIISTDPVDDPALYPVNKDPGTNDDPSTVENAETGNTPVDEEASAPGAVKTEVNPEGIIPAAPKNDDDATSAPEPASGSESPLVTGCAFDGEEYFEPFGTCVPSVESFDFWSVVAGEEPWPDSAGGYVGLAGGFVEDWLSLAGLNTAVSASLTEDALVELGKDGGPIGWGIQGVGYTVGFVGEAGGMLLVGAGEVAGAVHDGLGEAVDAIGDAAEDVWDEISSWW